MKPTLTKLAYTLLLALGLASSAGAINCSTNCARMCGSGVAGVICRAECEVAVAAACAVEPALPTWGVLITNNCRVNIQVAAHWMTPTHTWKTDGWWQLGPGEQAKLFSTRNRYVYLYAESTPHGQFTWSGTHEWAVRGRTVGFKQKYITGIPGGTWSHRFTCD